MRKILRACAGLSVLVGLFALVFVTSPAAAAPGDAGTSFTAYLSGANEVPGRGVSTTGMASFHISDDGQSVSYSVAIPSVMNVMAGHIHLGAPGQNGPVVVFLYMGKAGGGQMSLNYTGTFTAADFVGPLKGQPMSALTSQLANNAYVNFHTDDGSMVADKGPGDFPGGETRGQIKSADNGRIGQG